MLDFSAPFLDSGDQLICFGDSLTQAGAYEAELQRLLPDNKIINGGRGGDKTPWALTRFQSDVLDQKPEAVLIFLGANDAAVGRGVWADEPIVPVQTYMYNLIWMVHLAKLNGIKKIAIATPLASFEGPAFLMHGDILRDYCLAARQAADTMQVRLVPLDAMSKRVRKNIPWDQLDLTRDGTHPTADTYKLIGQEIFNAFHQ